MEKLDGVQRRFLHEVGVEETTAFLEFNFAPPTLRRNIGMLGHLHKRVLGKAHPVFSKLLPFHFDCFGELRRGEHNKQLYNNFLKVQFQHALFNRSIFGMAHIYNRLPQHLMDCASVSSFQRGLTSMVRDACRIHASEWQSMFACRL